MWTGVASRRFLFIGPPGVGKGTYASRIAAATGLAHISSGDLLRAVVASNPGQVALKGDAAGIAETLRRGEMVSDGMVTALVRDHISNVLNPGTGYILDGFPRTAKQAADTANVIAVDWAVNLRQPISVIVKKVSGRVHCPHCKHGYNLADIDEAGLKMAPLRPKVPGVCDGCGGAYDEAKLERRPDDELETVLKRLRAYEAMAAPLLAFYEQRGRLVHFDATDAKAYRVLLAKLEALPAPPRET